MAKLFKNRTDNDIKNKWYSMSRSEQRMSAKLGISVVGCIVDHETTGVLYDTNILESSMASSPAANNEVAEFAAESACAESSTDEPSDNNMYAV